MPPLRRSVFRVPRMDCPVEESLVRTALDGVEDVRSLEFDLPGRSLTVWHAGEAAAVLRRIDRLQLGARLERSEEVEICTTNDVLANIGVIVAGGLVAWTRSAVPDLVVGTTIAAVVLQGALRILRL